MKPDIYQVECIGSGFLAVMAKPIAGEWIEDEFSGIAYEGIRQIVSLLEPHESYELGLQNEEMLAIQYGMEYISFPIKDRHLPSSLKQFSELTTNLYHQIASGKNTVIHCRSGIGRSSLVAGGVLLHCGFTAKHAFEHISQKRGVQVPDTKEQTNWLIANSEIILNTYF